MKIQRATSNDGAQHEYIPTPADYDAAPGVISWRMDHRPSKLNPDREAVACYLAFGRWASGHFEVPARLSVATARAIMDHAGPVTVDVQPREYHPKALPRGSRHLLLTETWPRDLLAEPCLVDLRCDLFSGSLRSHRSLALPTNGFLLKKNADDVGPLLALGVLFAEDLEANVLVLPRRPDPAEEARLAALLASVCLGIDFWPPLPGTTGDAGRTRSAPPTARPATAPRARSGPA